MHHLNSISKTSLYYFTKWNFIPSRIYSLSNWTSAKLSNGI